MKGGIHPYHEETDMICDRRAKSTDNMCQHDTDNTGHCVIEDDVISYDDLIADQDAAIAELLETTDNV